MPELPAIKCADCPRLLTDPVSRARKRGPKHYREYLAAHPELAPRRRSSVPVVKSRLAVELIPGQQNLFETQEGSDA